MLCRVRELTLTLPLTTFLYEEEYCHCSIVLIVLILAGVSLYQSERLSAAKAYIYDLETDYPEFIDTTSGGDAYSEWYN